MLIKSVSWEKRISGLMLLPWTNLGYYFFYETKKDKYISIHVSGLVHRWWESYGSLLKSKNSGNELCAMSHGVWRPVYHIFVIPDIDKLKYSLVTTLLGVIKNIIKFMALADLYNL